MHLFAKIIPERDEFRGVPLIDLHSYVNTANHYVTAVRFWSGEFSIQDVTTPTPDNRPYRLVNIPFYYIAQLQDILKQV